MKNQVKNIVVVVCFIIITSGFSLMNILTPDIGLSRSERRKLKEAPGFSFESFLNGDLFREFEKYSLDQFVFRDEFRGIKAFGRYYLLLQKDNNGIYIVDGNINKMEYPLNENSVLDAAKKLNDIHSRYLQGLNVSYAIVPDKNYFLASKNGYLSMDYDRMKEIMDQKVTDMNYIDLFGLLDIEDYYSTDLHWSQDRIIDVADKLLEAMGNAARASDIEYTRHELYPFYGSYYGQAALKVPPDTLVYLSCNLLENAVAFDYQLQENSKVYVPDRFGEMDSYDVFLSGAKPLISISNPEFTGEKELILFRDSFGSSIAPLLLAGYSKITLVDLRYITMGLLGDYIDFSRGQDVLFLYNTQVLNHSAMLK